MRMTNLPARTATGPFAAVASCLVLALVGCEPGAEDLVRRAGPGIAHAAELVGDTGRTVTRRVLAHDWVDWTGTPSPDGRAIAHTDWTTGDLAVMDLATQDVRRLTTQPEPYAEGMAMFPQYSPDGERLVYGWWDDARPFEWGLRIIDLEGGEPRVLYDLESTTWIQATDWSPDGNDILALRSLLDGTNELVLVSSADGEVRILRSFDWRSPMLAKFSPDGRHIIYDFPPEEDRPERDLFMLSLAEGREIRLAEHPADDRLLGWAPGGDHVLFGSERGGTPGAWVLPVSAGRAAGEPVLVKPDFWRAAPMEFALDGRYFYGVDVGNQNAYFASLDTAEGRVVGSPVAVSQNAGGSVYNPAWSPDGRQIAFRFQSSPPGGRFLLGIRSIDTGETRTLPFPSEAVYPRTLRWTPDGQSLVFSSRDRSNRQGIYRLDVQTGRMDRLLRIAADRGIQQIDLAPDGGWFAYQGWRRLEDGGAEHELGTFDLADGAHRLLLRSPAQIRNPALSPDGRSLVFTHVHTTNTGRSAVKVAALDGGEVRTVLEDTDSRASAVWTPDGRHLVVADRRAGEQSTEGPFIYDLELVPLDGGEPRPMGLSMELIHRIQLSPDGRRIAFQGGRRNTEIWVMEDFLPAGGGVSHAGGSSR